MILRMITGTFLIVASFFLASAAVDYALDPVPGMVAWCSLFAMISGVLGTITVGHALLEINDVE